MDIVTDVYRPEVDFLSLPEKQNVKIIIDRLNESEIKHTIAPVIERFTLINVNNNDKKFKCPKGMSIRKIVEGDKMGKEELFFKVAQSLVSLLQVLSLLNVSHDNITEETVILCKQSPSEASQIRKLKLIDFSHMKPEENISTSNRDRASVVILLEFIIRKGVFKYSFKEQCACDIVRMLLSGTNWDTILNVITEVKQFNEMIKKNGQTATITNSISTWTKKYNKLRSTIFTDMIDMNDTQHHSLTNLVSPVAPVPVYYLADIKFGFEYETLVKVINPKFFRLVNLASVNMVNRLVKCDQTHFDETASDSGDILFGDNHSDYSDYSDDFDDSYDERQKRYLFTHILQSISDVQFSFSSGFHGEICDIISDNDKYKDESRRWVVANDGSVKCDAISMDCNAYLNNVEIVSPILSYSEVSGEYFRVVLDRILTANGWFEYHNNRTTSNHVHLSHNDNFMRADILFKCVMCWVLFEPVFMTFVSADRRRNKYCMSLTNHVHAFESYKDLIKCKSSLDFFDMYTNMNEKLRTRRDFIDIVRYFQNAKYFALNFSSLEKYKTIEVRLKHGSNNSKENQQWMLLLGHFFVYAMNNQCVTETHKVLLKQKNEFGGDLVKLKDAFWTIIANSELKQYWEPEPMKRNSGNSPLAANT